MRAAEIHERLVVVAKHEHGSILVSVGDFDQDGAHVGTRGYGLKRDITPSSAGRLDGMLYSRRARAVMASDFLLVAFHGLPGRPWPKPENDA